MTTGIYGACWRKSDTPEQQAADVAAAIQAIRARLGY